MIAPYVVKPNQAFIGRNHEQALLRDIARERAAVILVMYGRRRVGKTELIEQTYANRNIIKLEGIEGLSEDEQRRQVLLQLSYYMQDPQYASLQYTTWTEVFMLIAKLLQQGEWTLYFEEVQWLADYQPHFISELKYAWDNAFRHNHQLRLILCGSSPSFMINEVMHSKALYNRSQYEIHLAPLTLQEAKDLMPHRSQREIMDAYLTLGGMPDYLKRVNQSSSVFLSLCEQSFRKGGFFFTEYKRIFISSLSESTHYKHIIEFLSHERFTTRQEIAKHLGISPGGTLTKLLTDLRLCDFIEEYTSFHLPNSSSLVRYCVSDNYLVFYYKFIKPLTKQIESGMFDQSPTTALKQDTYYKWLGFSFERFCRKNSFTIAKMLGFSGIQYQSGPYFSKRTDTESPGFQIDLIFYRADQVITVCEIKYLQSKVDVQIIEEFERKLLHLPNPRHRTIHRVLIAANGVTDELLSRHYFDHIIVLDDFFSV